MDRPLAPGYADLLHEAHELGRADGRFAAPFEPAGRIERRVRCLGRTPEQFARLLWENRPGDPPAGLLVNAPLWYAAGFEQALADACSDTVPGGRPARRRSRAAVRRYR